MPNSGGIGIKNQEVLWTADEGIIAGDLNDMTRYVRAFLADQLVGGMPRQRASDQGMLSTLPDIWAAPGQAAPIQPGSNLKLDNNDGLLLQLQAAPDGLTPQLLAYHMDANELWGLLSGAPSTFAAGDPSHDRFDLVCVKLQTVDTDSQSRDFQDASTLAVTSSTTNKKRRVQLLAQIVQGTPGLTPAIPALPAGYSRWAVVRIPTSTTTGTQTSWENIYDCRVPFSAFKQQTAWASDMFVWSSTWTLTQGIYLNTAGGTGRALMAPFKGGHHNRIMRYRGKGTSISASGLRMQPVSFIATFGPPYTFTLDNAPNGLSNTIAGAGQPTDLSGSLAAMVDLTGALTLPVWGNGWGNPNRPNGGYSQDQDIERFFGVQFDDNGITGNLSVVMAGFEYL
jgi:hypothetical protein